ncbi:hypothetical protein Vafri_11140 [Volvox africanus]|uniref:Uncharacterized protein n=1 Tax=Volvox africanus TaxID=51714 RepID=A0A8J4F321_9CHLO|nr:hypothetical protein Vafri_11140 [Volvox africanus]
MSHASVTDHTPPLPSPYSQVISPSQTFPPSALLSPYLSRIFPYLLSPPPPLSAPHFLRYKRALTPTTSPLPVLPARPPRPPSAPCRRQGSAAHTGASPADSGREKHTAVPTVPAVLKCA